MGYIGAGVTRFNTADELTVTGDAQIDGTTLVVDSTNNRVGVGTASPSYLIDAQTSSGNAQFQLKSGSDLAQILLHSTDTTGNSQINFADADSSNVGMLQYFHSDNHMEFTVNSSEAMRIDSSGRFMVGKTSTGLGNAGAELDPSGQLKGTAANVVVQYLNRTSSDGDIAEFRKDNTTVGSIGTANSGDLYIGNDDTTLLFAGGSDAILPRGTAGAARDGAIDLGLSAHRFKDFYLGGNINFLGGTNDAQYINFGDTDDADIGNIFYYHGNNNMVFTTNASEAMRIDSSGNVGIGTSSPDTNLDVERSSNDTGGIKVQNTNNTQANAVAQVEISGGDNAYANLLLECNATNHSIRQDGSGNLKFINASTESLRIDSSGNVGIGTSSPNGNLTVASTGDAELDIVADSDNNGTNQWPILNFRRNSTTGTPAAKIYQKESDDALVFDNSGAERMRIDSSGNMFVGKTATGNTTGTEIRSNGRIQLQTPGDDMLRVNRTSDDGALILLRQDGTTEGTISVSGTTVTYGGGHLARWSRLSDNSKDTSIVKGTVMTNLDQMVEWGDEDNEQLNCTAVSSTEGDVNVAGVFVSWDESDEWNDYYVAMTGDMVIRIAQGTTVARGDLLMSAGDGTAKPQGDDIVRSKTIAKVTSTNVSHTYDDGTYLVPCVLMAC